MPPELKNRPISNAVLGRAAQLGYTPLQARILAGRLTDEEAPTLERRVSPRLPYMDGPWSLPDIEPAVQRICQAVVDGETVVLNSDFDCDGVSAQVVMLKAMTEVFGHPRSKVKSVIGLRLRDGYGMSSNVTDRILKEVHGPALCITADQGSADEERIATLRRHGIQTVVTDHHGIPEAGPPASAVACVNPMRADSAFPDRCIAGVHVAFLVMCAVRQRLIESGILRKDTASLAHLADIVALGVTADAVSFARSINNRAIVSHGLSLMNHRDARAPWRALRRLLKKDDAFTAQDISFGLGPLCNSAGRLSDAMAGVHYLMEDDEERAFELLQMLDVANKERREIEKRMTERAMRIASDAVAEGRAGIVIYMEDGHPGVHGVTASRIVEAFGRPVACLSPKAGLPGQLTGSLRGIPGVHLRDCLAEIHELHPTCQSGFGGHAGACGTHLPLSKLEVFREAFDAAVRKRVGSRDLAPWLWTDGDLPVTPSLAVLPELAALHPYGREFDPPVFTIPARVEQARPVGDMTHLQLTLVDQAGIGHSAIWFRAIGSDGVQPVRIGDERRFAVELAANTYRQQTRLQLMVRAAV